MRRLGVALDVPGDHGRRHQRQGLDLRDARAHPARPAATASACYTSPHLLRYNERVRIGGAERRRRRAAATRFEAVEARARRRRAHLLRVRHAGGALAVRARRRSSVVILEVGLGGRLDAVNVVDADCAVRHQHRPRPRRLPRRRRASRSAARRRASSAPAGPRSAATAIRRQRCSTHARRDRRRRCCASGAISASRRARSSGAIGAAAARGTGCRSRRCAALASSPTPRRRWPRSTRLRERLPVSHGRGARRPRRASSCRGASRCCRAARDACSTSRTTRRPRARWRRQPRRHGLLPRTPSPCSAIMGDKDIDGVVAAVAPRVDRWHVATLPPPRGATAASCARALEHCRRRRGDACATSPIPRRRWRAALGGGPGTDRIVVFGSFYTVAAALRLPQRRPSLNRSEWPLRPEAQPNPRSTI